MVACLHRPAPPGAEAAPQGVSLTRLAPAVSLPALSHALAPASVLHVAVQLGQPVPPTWLLAVQGEAFELGEGLSEPARLRLADAVARALGWLAARRAEAPPPGIGRAGAEAVAPP